MIIQINGRQAYIKQGSTFELSFENHRFSGADSYSLSIVFPIVGCAENAEIFGNINRKDVRAGKAIYDCRIMSGRLQISGALVVVGVSASEVKGQFLSGKSATNFHDDWDSIMINELPVSYEGIIRQPQQDEGLKPSEWTRSIDDPDFIGLRLRWCNSDSNVAYNHPNDDDSGWIYGMNSEMHYLVHLIQAVFKSVGFTCDLSEIHRTDLRFLVVCNSTPSQATQNYRYLPEWSLSEFIEQLELFLRGEFEINRIDKTAYFRFYSDINEALPGVTLKNVISEFSSEISKEELCESNYIDMKNLAYADGGHEMDKYWNCPWFIKSWSSRVIKYPSVNVMYAENAEYNYTTETTRGPENKLLYAEDADTYFILRTVSSYPGADGQIYHNVLQPVNIFGPRIVVDDDDAATEELKIVPACFDHHFEMFLAPQFNTDCDYELEDTYPLYETEEERSERLSQTIAARVLAGGEREKNTSLYDKLYVAFWDGENGHVNSSLDWPPTAFVYNYAPYSRVLNQPQTLMHMFEPMCDLLRLNGGRFKPTHHIDTRQKYTIEFLSDEVPDPQSVFNIGGRRYLCEKITTKIGENGLSQRMKGVFFMID